MTHGRRLLAKKGDSKEKSLANVKVLLNSRCEAGFACVEKKRSKLCKVHRKKRKNRQGEKMQKGEVFLDLGKLNLLFEKCEKRVYNKKVKIFFKEGENNVRMYS